MTGVNLDHYGDALMRNPDTWVWLVVAVLGVAAPTKGYLQGSVQVGDGAVAADEQASPDQRANAAQDDAQLVHEGSGRRRRLGHPRHHGARPSLTGSPSSPNSVHSRGSVPSRSGPPHQRQQITSWSGVGARSDWMK